MRVPLTCAECMQTDLENSTFVARAELVDHGGYDVFCPKGHRSHLILQQQRFEILFEIGICALRDGYYREAVSSFTSSLERFREFFIRAFFIQSGKSSKAIEEFWSVIAKHSERQLGAFNAIHLCEFGTSSKNQKRADIELRNEVVHRGTIPNRPQSILYGQSVLDLIRPALAGAKERFPEGTSRSVFLHMQTARGKFDPNLKVVFSSMPTLLSLNIVEPSHQTMTIEDYLKQQTLWQFPSESNSSSL